MTPIKQQQLREIKGVLVAKPQAGFDENSLSSNPREKVKGGVLIEVLIALFIFMASSAYLISSEIKTRVLWQTTLKSQNEQIQLLNTERLANTQDHVDQNWEDIAVFGIPTTTP
ncbi:type II secretion system protein [Alteromonas portus]|uniref:type II secretion system protein n=1 Tax=Alteromonas portus TaxID=2565549 RepID=UPI003BF91843